MSESHRFYVGPAASFSEKSRQLIKCGERNVAVFFYKGEFSALDNACYHHGGPLAEGDIEDMDGRPCVVCPWHQYHITLDTGECLYWGLQLTPGKIPDRTTAQVVRSKGLRQRKHIVSVENGEVYVILNASSPSLESDTYAKMPLANQELSMKAPVLIANGGKNRGIHSGMRSGEVLNGPSLLGKGWNMSREPMTPSPRVVECTRMEHVCDNTKKFYFRLCVGQFPVPLVPGQFVDLELPIPSPSGEPTLRRWTVCEVDKGSDVFTIVVKISSKGFGGSVWLSENAIHQRLPLRNIGGSFTLSHHFNDIREVGGRVLMLSAGVGVTPAYASLHHHFEEKMSQNEQKLFITHLHVDRTVSSVPQMRSYVQWHKRYSGESIYRFHCYLTHQTTSSVSHEWLSFVECGSRPGEKHIALFAKEVFPDALGLAFLSGPSAFVNTCKNALLSVGFLEKYILMDENLW